MTEAANGEIVKIIIMTLNSLLSLAVAWVVLTRRQPPLEQELKEYVRREDWMRERDNIWRRINDDKAELITRIDANQRNIIAQLAVIERCLGRLEGEHQRRMDG